MALSAATAIDKPPRRAVPLKPRERKPRVPGAYLAWKRARDENERWGMLLKVGLDPALGSHLGRMFAQGELNEHQADAGVYLAKFCAAADRVSGSPKRNSASPTYEKGFMNSRNDEEALARLQGNIDDYDKRNKRIRRKWERIHGYIGDEKVFSLLLDVCVHDQSCPVMQIPRLRAALELLVIKLGINRIRPEDQPRMQPKRKRFKPKQEDQNDRRRDPSSYYNRDAAPAAAVPVPQGGGSS